MRSAPNRTPAKAGVQGSKRRRLRLWIPACAGILMGAQLPAETIFIAGDSTAQTYKQDRYPQTGWGQMLPCGLTGDVQVENRAMGGRSTKSFIAEGRWDKIMADIKPGDVVLIQFGHNDASQNKPERYAPAATLYRDNLLRMVWETKGHGATPILITPVTRRSFGPDGKSKADFAAWSAVVRDIAATTGTQLIDLEASSRGWVDAKGVEGSKALFLHYPAGRYPGFKDGIADDTHFSELGARGVAELIAADLTRTGLPVAAKVAKVRPDLTRTTPLGTMGCR